MFKRIIVISLSAVMILSSMTFTGWAASDASGTSAKSAEHHTGILLEPMEGHVLKREEGSPAASDRRAMAKAKKPVDPSTEAENMMYLNEVLREALLTGKSKMVVEDKKIRWKNSPQLVMLGWFSPYVNGHPQFIKNKQVSIDYSYYEDSPYIYQLNIYNKMNRENSKKWVEKIDRELAKLDKVVKSAPATEEKQALALHDHMAATFYYDLNYDETPNMNSVFPSLMLNLKKGVCQSYAFLYQYVLMKNGFECYTTVSHDVMNHAWNLIKIDGKFYNVDITWDDPTHDILGRVTHDYFLLSDDAIVNMSEDDSERVSDRNLPYVKCDSDRFADAPWRKAISSVVYDGNDAYYVYYDKDKDNSETPNYLVKNGDTKHPIDELGYWHVTNEGAVGYEAYECAFTGLSLLNGKLYYNTSDQLKSYDLKTKQKKVLWTNDHPENGEIYGSQVENGWFHYSIQVDKDVPYIDQERPWIEVGKHVDDYCNHPSRIIKTKAGLLKNGYSYEKCIICDEVYNRKVIPGYAAYYVLKPSVRALNEDTISVKWKKQTAANQKKFGGYQIRYSDKDDMSGAVTVGTARKFAGKKLTRLLPETKYYVQVRTYTKKNGNTYYSKWSNKMSAETAAADV